MRPYYHVPGVPAAGHISRGYWHPGRIDGCRKCPPTDRTTQNGTDRVSPDRRHRAPADMQPTFKRLPDGRALVRSFHLPAETAALVELANELAGDGDVYDYLIHELLPAAAQRVVDEARSQDGSTPPGT